jgi:ligand-binding sensor domain-containing protein
MVWTIAFDPQGRPWVGTHRGAAVLQGKAWQWLTTTEGLGGEDANAFLWTPDGRMWIGTDRSIDLFAAGRKVAQYTWNDGMAASSAEDLARDDAGNVWAAHLAEGVSRFDGERWRTYTVDNGLLDNWVYAIAPDCEGNLWFGTLGGVSRYDGAGWTSLTTADGLADAWVADVAVAPDGRLWFATHAGLDEYDGTGLTAHLIGRHVAAVAVADDGTVWAAGGGFVSRYDGAEWQDVKAAWFADQNLTTIALRDNGEVWVGSLDNGATVLAPVAARRTGVSDSGASDKGEARCSG